MAALKRMTARDRGVIIQVGSALSYRAIPLQAAYCGSKFAIRGFTDSLRVELLHDKSHVRITMVQLPGVNTTQFNWCRSKLPDHPQPVPPIYQPEIPAEAVYWAAHHRRRELWVGYSAVQAIVGGTIAPSFADWYLARTGNLRAAGRRTSGQPRPSGQPVRAANRSSPPPTACSTTRPRPAARSCGSRPTGGCWARWPPAGRCVGAGMAAALRSRIVSGSPRSRRSAASAYRIPTEQPGVRRNPGVGLGDGRRRRGGSRRAAGIGYTYTDRAAAALIEGVLADAVTGRDADAVPGAWWAMVHAIRNLGWKGICATAIAAVDVALWDLKARLLGVWLADLLGPRPRGGAGLWLGRADLLHRDRAVRAARRLGAATGFRA